MNLDIRYDADDEELTIEHREYGFTKGFTITSSKDGILVDGPFEPQLFLGQDIEGTINDEPAEGDGLVLTGDFKNSKTSGLSVAYLGDGTGNAGAVTVAQNALKFQSGTSADEQIKVALNSTHSSVLGRGVDNTSGFENLSQIRLTSTQEAIDAIRLVDEALDQLTSMRGQLGSVQKHTLETNISVLRSSAENLTAAESSIRDTDMALEIANFTKNQIITETAAAAVAQANQTAARVLRLLFSNNAHNHWSFFGE
jgi:flagellin